MDSYENNAAYTIYVILPQNIKNEMKMLKEIAMTDTVNLKQMVVGLVHAYAKRLESCINSKACMVYTYIAQ